MKWPREYSTDIKSISNGASHQCAIKIDGSMTCWKSLDEDADLLSVECCKCTGNDINPENRYNLNCGHWICTSCLEGMDNPVCPSCKLD